jgi:hypothetical protein
VEYHNKPEDFLGFFLIGRSNEGPMRRVGRSMRGGRIALTRRDRTGIELQQPTAHHGMKKAQGRQKTTTKLVTEAGRGRVGVKNRGKTSKVKN